MTSLEEMNKSNRSQDILKTPDNIPPSNIEGVLLQHPDILDVGVVGIYEASQELQLVRAYVVKRPRATTSEEDICRWMEKETSETSHLTAGVEFLKELPRNEVSGYSSNSRSCHLQAACSSITVSDG